MPDAQALRISDLSGGMNDTRDPILLADSELPKCRNVLWRNGRLETRRGYIEVKHIKFEQTEDADIHTATTVGKTGWSVITDEFNGYTVEIYNDAGSPQTQTITATTKNVADGYVTVADWDGVIGDPAAGSDFRIYAPVKKLYRYIKQDGTEILLAHTGKHIFKSTDGTTWTQVVVTDNESAEIIFTMAAQMSFITYQGKVFGFNGTENVWSYDGTNTFVYDRDEDPGAATGNGAAGMTSLIDTDLTEAEDYWKNFKIYFTEVNSNFDLSREVTAFKTATDEVEFAAVVAQTQTGDTYYMGPDIPKAAYAAVCQRRIFGLMRSDDDCHYSGLDDYWYWPDTNYFVTEVGEGQRNTGIVDYLGKLIVFKERTTVKYEVSHWDPAQWSKETVSANIGCAHNDSIQVLAINGVDHLVWLSYEGFCIMGPDWQVRNISKDRLDVLFNDLQMPTYVYREKVWTTTSDFTGTEDPADSIDQTGDEFTLSNGSKTWDAAGTGATGFNNGTLTDLIATNNYLEITFQSEQIREENSAGGDAWAILDTYEWQTFKHDGGALVTKIQVYLKKDGTEDNFVNASIWDGPTRIAFKQISSSGIGGGGWIEFAFSSPVFIKSDHTYKLQIDTVWFDTFAISWHHETTGDYGDGRSSVSATGDFIFRVYGYNASGTWESETINTSFSTGPMFGELSALSGNMGGNKTVTYEIASRSADSGWPTADWYLITDGEHIFPDDKYQYFRIKATLTTDTYDDSPTADDVVVPYSISQGRLVCADYNQTGNFDEWGDFNTSQTIPAWESVHIVWEYETADSAAGLDGSNWEQIQPGDEIPSPSSDTWIHWRCIMDSSNSSKLPSVQDVTVDWLDWTAGGTLTAVISSGIWDDTYWFLGAERDSSTNNIVIVIDRRGSLWPMDIAMNSIAQFKNQLFGGDTEGKVYYMDVGYNDNGSAYTPYAETKEFGSPELEYLHTAFDAVLEKMGSYDLTVGYIIDPALGSSGVLTYTTLATIDLSGVGTLPKRVRFDSTNNLVGHFIRFKFSTAAANNPFFLYGFSVWRLPFGLRGEPDAEAAQTALDPARHID